MLFDDLTVPVCDCQVMFKVKVPRTKPQTPREVVDEPDEEVIVDGFVDEGLTSEAARRQAYNMHAMFE